MPNRLAITTKFTFGDGVHFDLTIWNCAELGTVDAISIDIVHATEDTIVLDGKPLPGARRIQEDVLRLVE